MFFMDTVAAPTPTTLEKTCEPRKVALRGADREQKQSMRQPAIPRLASFPYNHFGVTTVSMTWITPLSAATSAETIFAPSKGYNAAFTKAADV